MAINATSILLGNSTLGGIFNAVTTNYTGEGSMTFFLLIVFLVAVLIGFAVDVELIFIFSTPLILLGYIMYPNTLMGAILGFQLFYIAILFAKRVIINS